MELRDPSMSPPPQGPSTGPTRWTVSPGLVALKVIGALALAAAALLTLGGDPLKPVVAGAAAVAVGVLAMRDLIAPARLAADHEGVTVVTGFARRVRLPWSAIADIRVDTRNRYGVRAEQLEIDTGHELYLFGAFQLGTQVPEVADTLRAIRSSAT